MLNCQHRHSVCTCDILLFEKTSSINMPVVFVITANKVNRAILTKLLFIFIIRCLELPICFPYYKTSNKCRPKQRGKKCGFPTTTKFNSFTVLNPLVHLIQSCVHKMIINFKFLLWRLNSYLKCTFTCTLLLFILNSQWKIDSEYSKMWSRTEVLIKIFEESERWMMLIQ